MEDSGAVTCRPQRWPWILIACAAVLVVLAFWRPIRIEQPILSTGHPENDERSYGCIHRHSDPAFLAAADELLERNGVLLPATLPADWTLVVLDGDPPGRLPSGEPVQPWAAGILVHTAAEFSAEHTNGYLDFEVRTATAPYEPARGEWIFDLRRLRETTRTRSPTCCVDAQDLPSELSPYPSDFHHVVSSLSWFSAVPPDKEMKAPETAAMVMTDCLEDLFLRDGGFQGYTGTWTPEISREEFHLWMDQAPLQCPIPALLTRVEDWSAESPYRKLVVSLDGDLPTDAAVLDAVDQLRPYCVTDGGCWTAGCHGMVHLEAWLLALTIRAPELTQRVATSTLLDVHLLRHSPELEDSDGYDFYSDFYIVPPPWLQGTRRESSVRCWHEAWDAERNAAYALLPPGLPEELEESAAIVVRAAASRLGP